MIQAIARWLAPASCFGCAVTVQSVGLCSSCYRQLTPIVAPYCTQCAAPLPYLHAGCDVCDMQPPHPHIQQLRAAFLYQGVAQSMMLRFKSFCHPVFVRWLSRHLAQLSTDLPAIDAVVCVPISQRVFWQRTYNQAAVLAHRVARHRGVPFYIHALHKKWHALPQKSLNRAHRLAHAQQLIGVGKHIKHIRDKSVLLIDDVRTTGATLEACAALLHAHGARAVYGMVACYTPVLRHHKKGTTAPENFATLTQHR